MTMKTAHLTEEALTRTSIASAPAHTVSIRVLRGYGLELTLYESTAPSAPAKVTYRDLNPTREYALKHPMGALAYTLRRRPGVTEPFDVEITYDEAAIPDAND